MSAVRKPSRGLLAPTAIVLLFLIVLSLAVVGLLALYVEHAKKVMVQRGIAEPDQLRLSQVSLNASHGVVFKMDAADRPTTEVTLHLWPWQDGTVAFKREYRERQ